jgi:hypothetical protein
MRSINRSVAVVRPREPYVKWATSFDDDARRREASIRERATVYLVPPDPKEEQEAASTGVWFADVFENELESWHLDAEAWPKRRDLQTFRKWFDVTLDSVVVDLADGPIDHEEW